MPKKPAQSLPEKPSPGIFASASTSPIKRPVATIAGNIGTKTSPIGFNNLFHRGCFAAAAAFTSSLVAAVIPVILKNSS